MEKKIKKNKEYDNRLEQAANIVNKGCTAILILLFIAMLVTFFSNLINIYF